MGAHGPGARAAERVRPLTDTQNRDPSPLAAVKPPADRLYGRVRGHALRPRQQRLLDAALPRLLVSLDRAPDPRSVFASRPARLALEVGFGGGEHAAALAAQQPDLGLIACEVFEPGLCSLLSRLVPDGVDEASAPLPGNLRLWDDDARLLMPALPDACLDLLVLMFPDPWPKARHARRRFVHPAQVPLVARLLKPGATWRVASDDPTYQAWVVDVMGAQDLFDPATAQPTRPDGWPPTRYEAKALRAGRVPLYWTFVRSAAAVPRASGAEAAWTQTGSSSAGPRAAD